MPGEAVRLESGSTELKPLFTVSRLLETGRTTELYPVYISLNLPRSAFSADVGGGGDDTYSEPKSVFECGFRGRGPHSDKVYLFKGDSFIELADRPGGGVAASDFARMTVSPTWPGWPASFSTGVDAALVYKDIVWFLKDGMYMSFNLDSHTLRAGPKPIAGNWKGLDPSFCQGVDAAIHGVGQYEDIAWLFKGDKYVRYNLRTDSAESGPKPIAPNWGQGTWPDAFANGIDFCFYGSGAYESEKIFFVRGDSFIRYDLKKDKVDAGPSPLTKNWPVLRRFMPTPQLYMVEQYELRTFNGGIGRGDIVGNQSVAGRGSTKYYVITKKSETIERQMSTNILESESNEAVKSFAEGTKNSDAEAGGESKYEYEGEASFEGEADATLTGGEVEAKAKFRGSSKDARSSFSKAVDKQIQTKADETRQTHKQQVKTEAESYTVQKEVETGFIQTIDNSHSDSPLNFSTFQLTQEYFTLLSLVSVKLAFVSGRGTGSRTGSLRDVKPLLDECLVDGDTRTRVETLVLDALTNIPDIDGKQRSLVVNSSEAGDRPSIDPDVSSKRKLKLSGGDTPDEIEVPGVLLGVTRSVVLTANTAVAALHV